MAKRKVSNPLALAVMACLAERPMHPYEMSATMRQRGKDESIKLNYGSLYTVVDALVRHGLIEAQETERAGRRPERTVYRLTPAGHRELVDWMTHLLSTPVKEYTAFEAGLCLMAALPPHEVVDLLRERSKRLEIEITQLDSVLRLAADKQLPRLFAVEGEYRLALRQAELEFTRKLARDIDSGTIDGTSWWARVHELAAEAPAGTPLSEVVPDWRPFELDDT